MKRMWAVLLVLGSVAATACTKPGVGEPATPAGGAQIGAPAARPESAKASASGGTYRGTVQRGYEITFVVSPDGKQVTKVAANVLEACEGRSTSSTTQLYWDGPFPIVDGVVNAGGKDPEFEELEFLFTAQFGADGSASGKVAQAGAGCTTYELDWTAKKD